MVPLQYVNPEGLARPFGVAEGLALELLFVLLDRGTRLIRIDTVN